MNYRKTELEIFVPDTPVSKRVFCAGVGADSGVNCSYVNLHTHNRRHNTVQWRSKISSFSCSFREKLAK